MRNFLLAMVVLCSGLSHAYATHAATPWEQQVPSAQTVGKGEFHYLFMHIYDAELSAPNGAFEPDAPYALKLTYHRAFDGVDIADESLRQMRKQGLKDEALLTRWGGEMRKVFPDVAKGDALTGVRRADGTTQFFHGEKSIGQINDPAFTDAFFGIWLSPKTTEPKLRKQLLGSAK